MAILPRAIGQTQVEVAEPLGRDRPRRTQGKTNSVPAEADANSETATGGTGGDDIQPEYIGDRPKPEPGIAQVGRIAGAQAFDKEQQSLVRLPGQRHAQTIDMLAGVQVARGHKVRVQVPRRREFERAQPGQYPGVGLPAGARLARPEHTAQDTQADSAQCGVVDGVAGHPFEADDKAVDACITALDARCTGVEFQGVGQAAGRRDHL